MANLMTAGVHKATTWSIVLSMLMIAAGVSAICVPVIAGVTVAAIVGSLLVFSSLLHLAFAWQGGRAGAVLWEVLLGMVYGAIGFYLLASPIAGLASLTLALAVMIWSTWPSSALWVVGTLVGISMFFSGITRLVLSMAVRRIVA